MAIPSFAASCSLDPSPSSFLCSITAVRRRCPSPSSIRFHRSRNGNGWHGDDNEHYSRSSIKYWDKFYKRHQNKFFKDRHYLEKDWGQYFSNDNSSSPNGKILLEVGCGAGNTIFPLIATYPNLFVHACDFSPHAISLVKSRVNSFHERINVFVCDIANDNICDNISPFSVDVVTLVYMLSAVSPEKMPLIIQNFKKVLKPDGCILLRDYAVGDFAQVKLQNKNQIISENFYFRGDGTCSFYFSEDFLSTLFLEAGFRIVNVNTHSRLINNRSRNIIMKRSWICAIFSHLQM